MIPHDGRMPKRTYRHLPWLGWCSLLLTLLLGGAVAAVRPAISSPAADTVSKAVFVVFWVALFALFPLGCLRIRTVIDDEAVTQYWITRSFRIPLAEITDVELDDGVKRWFLRVHQGERTYEIIPCMVVSSPGGNLFPDPPRALLDVYTDLDTRLAARR